MINITVNNKISQNDDFNINKNQKLKLIYYKGFTIIDNL